MLKKFILGGFLLLTINEANAQVASAAPYCDPAFKNQYNMFNTMKVKGTDFSFGPLGKPTKKDSFFYYNTVVFPDFSRGDTASLEIIPYATPDIEPIYFAVWIDYDQSNTFEPAELVMQNSNTIMKALPFTGDPIIPLRLTITVPASAVSGKTRMRVMRGTNTAKPYDPYSAAFVLNPCPVVGPASNTYGCTYDFDVNIDTSGTPPPPPPPPPAVPKADFASSDTFGTTHTTFTFTDKSTNKPTSWYWTFTPSATVSYVSGLANSQNLSVKFTMPGKYSVKLVAANADGKDSVIKTNYVVTLPTSIRENIIQDQVLFSPNPATAGKIQLTSEFAGAELRIIDMSGKLVLQQESAEASVDVSAFRPGTYFVSVLQGGKTYLQTLQVNP